MLMKWIRELWPIFTEIERSKETWSPSKKLVPEGAWCLEKAGKTNVFSE